VRFMKNLFFAMCILFAVNPAFAKDIVYVETSEAKDKYHIDLLKFLFKDDANYQLKISKFTNLSYDRTKAEIEEGNVTIAAFATDTEIEKRLRPIRIPILKGLLGHRVFIIRGDDQARFSTVESFSDLLRYKAGQGRSWADTAVLQNAGIPTVPVLKYPNLFYMLEGGRFDYFPRALHEPFSEIAARPELGLAVEKELMLVYPLALYLFVARDNTELAQVITDKLNAKIESGEFDEFFFNYPLIKDVLNKVNVQSRRVFRIDNPNLSPETPLENKSYWLNLEDLSE